MYKRQSQNKEELSDLALSNVEALTLGTKDCMYQRNSRCYELVVGPPGCLLYTSFLWIFLSKNLPAE